MKAYTDYPFEGNENGSTIEVEVLAYDRNKYAQVNWNGEIHEVKTGYLYREPERQKNLKYSELIALPIEVGGKKKGFGQIKDIPDSYIVSDDLEIGIGNKIPLWLFGCLY